MKCIVKLISLCGILLWRARQYFLVVTRWKATCYVFIVFCSHGSIAHRFVVWPCSHSGSVFTGQITATLASSSTTTFMTNIRYNGTVSVVGATWCYEVHLYSPLLCPFRFHFHTTLAFTDNMIVASSRVLSFLISLVSLGDNRIVWMRNLERRCKGSMLLCKQITADNSCAWKRGSLHLFPPFSVVVVNGLSNDSAQVRHRFLISVEKEKC